MTVQIKDLDPRDSVAGADQFPLETAGGVTMKATLSQIATYVEGQVNSTSDPLAPSLTAAAGTATALSHEDHVHPSAVATSATADLPSAATAGAGAVALVTDLPLGAAIATSDGTDWRTALGEVPGVAAMSGTYGGLVTDLDGPAMQKLALTGAVTGWTTSNRALGRRIAVLLSSAPDATFTRASAANDPYTAASVASGVARFPQSTINKVQYSEPASLHYLYAAAGVTTTGAGVVWPGANNGIDFGDNSILRFAYVQTSQLADSTSYVVSAFVHMDDGAAPVVGTSTTTGDFGIAISGALITSAATVVSLGRGLYRVYVSAPTGVGPASNAGIIKYPGQSERTFSVSGFQVEPGTGAPTVYNPTGTPIPGQGLRIEPGAANLVSANQSDLETDLTGYGVNGLATITRITTDSWQGTACVEVAATASGGDGITFTSGDMAPATSGQPYSLSAYLKPVSGSGIVDVAMQEYQDSSTFLRETSLSAVHLASGWNRYVVSATTGANTTLVRLVVRTPTATAVTFRMDGVQIENSLAASSWITGQANRGDESLSIPQASVPCTAAAGTIIGLFYVDGDAAGVGQLQRFLLCSTGAPGSGNNALHLWRNGPTNDLRFQLITSGGSVTGADLTSTLAVGWHWYCITYDATSMILTIDGEDVQTTDTPGLPSSLGAWYVGSTETPQLQWGYDLGFVAFFANKLANQADRQSLTNPHDPTLVSRIQAEVAATSYGAGYAVDFSAVSAANGGNLAPARPLALNDGWAVVGPDTRPTVLPSGKRARVTLEAFGTTEADVVCHYAPETA